jgi:hypothetical protein
VTETVKEGKTIFRLATGTPKTSAADITPLFAALGGHRFAPRTPALAALAAPGGPVADGCVHEGLFQLATAMAAGTSAR